MFLFFVLTALLIALALGMSYWLTGFVAEGKVLRLVRGLLLLFDGGMIAAVFIGPKYLRDISFAVEVVMFFAVLIVVQFIFCVLVGLALLLRRARELVVEDVPFDGGRRKLLQHAAVYPAAAFGMGLYGNLWERNQTVVNRYEIPAGVPGNLSGFTLAQISDVHIGMFYSLEMLQALLRKAAELKPDALVITGDIFDHVKMNPEAYKAPAQVSRQTAEFFLRMSEETKNEQRACKQECDTHLEVCITQNRRADNIPHDQSGPHDP